jgi:RimJ/RimL family protein N-acetyltransferase
MLTDISLRDVQESDLPIFFEQQLQTEAIRMADFPPRNRVAFLAHWAKIMADATTIVKTIVCAGRVAGNIVQWIDRGERKVGFWLGKEYWGRGIASAALSQFLAQVKARPLRAHVAKHNLGSLRVLQKSGFVISGEAVFSGTDGEPNEEFILTLPARDQDMVE